MDQLTVEEVADLRDPVRRLCADRFDRAGVRESGQPQALDRDAWAELAEVGVFSAMAPEERGGLGLGVTPLAGLLEECGQRLAPGPLVWAALAAKHCIQIHGGMGCTWEADPHLLWKRAMVYDNAFAAADAHASAIAARLGA